MTSGYVTYGGPSEILIIPISFSLLPQMKIFDKLSSFEQSLFFSAQRDLSNPALPETRKVTKAFLSFDRFLELTIFPNNHF